MVALNMELREAYPFFLPPVRPGQCADYAGIPFPPRFRPGCCKELGGRGNGDRPDFWSGLEPVGAESCRFRPNDAQLVNMAGHRGIQRERVTTPREWDMTDKASWRDSRHCHPPWMRKASPTVARLGRALARFSACRRLRRIETCWGTTGEGDPRSSLEQRKRVMTGLPRRGPCRSIASWSALGAASVADAVALTRHAAEARLCRGAPAARPFLLQGACRTRGSSPYVETIVGATAAKTIPLYLYHFPALLRAAVALSN